METQMSAGEYAYIELEDDLLRFFPAAVTRIGYTNPELKLTLSGRWIKIVAAPANTAISVKRIVLHALYREKILADTLSLRFGLKEVLERR